MRLCESCRFKNVEDAESCVRCGTPFEVPEAESLLDLDSIHGHSAGFLQFNEIASASSAGQLEEPQVEALLAELHSYLKNEEGKFLSFEPIEGEPDYNEGVALIATGLNGLATQVQRAMDEGDWSAGAWATLLEMALEAEQRIGRGTDALQRAGADPEDEDGELEMPEELPTD